LPRGLQGRQHQVHGVWRLFDRSNLDTGGKPDAEFLFDGGLGVSEQLPPESLIRKALLDDPLPHHPTVSATHRVRHRTFLSVLPGSQAPAKTP
jgi:hypothetical protein